MKFDAVAFDLDGTLYPNYRLYVKLIPFLIKEHRLLRALGRARTLLRAGYPAHGTFYDRQAQIMANILKEAPELVKERTEKLIYRGWEPLFKNIRLYHAVKDSLQTLHDAGLKLGVLSDFPPEKKLDHLGLTGLWDTVLCSETLGALKPDKAPFSALVQALAVPAERILYVGNSIPYDVAGARNAGIHTALIKLPVLKRHISAPNPDFVFSDYRILCKYVLT